MKDDILIVLQVRSSSRRLPLKALLMIGGYPLFILAALRAKNTGIRVVVATSHNCEDDLIEKYCQDYGLPCVRGQLENVLYRFNKVLKLHESKYIVRLTADNVFPDGSFIEDVVRELQGKSLSYLATNMGDMPYGLSVEAFTRRAFIDSIKDAKNKDDFEHVTPAIRRKHESIKYTKAQFQKYSHLRCTIDTEEDFKVIALALCEVGDLVNASSLSLCELLVTSLENFKNIDGKIILGGAQIGSDYGYTRNVKNIDQFDWFDILDYAYQKNIRGIDTAQAYPNSEKIIGNFSHLETEKKISVFTKLLPFSMISPSEGMEEVIIKNLQESLLTLKDCDIAVVMFHRLEDVYFNNSIMVKEILKHFNLRLGVSVQDPNEFKKALNLDFISHIQFPFNLLDYRWIDDELIEFIKRKKNRVTIHARSLFLQGVILSTNPADWPDISVEYDKNKIIMTLLNFVENNSNNSVQELTFSFIKTFDWIDGYVIGLESKEQIDFNLRAYNASTLDQKKAIAMLSVFKELIPVELLSPSKWKKYE